MPEVKAEIISEPGPAEPDSDVEFVDWRMKTEEVDISDMEPDNESDCDAATIAPDVIPLNLHMEFKHEASPAAESYCCASCSQIFHGKKSLVKHVKSRCYSGIFPRSVKVAKSPSVKRNNRKSSAGKKVIPCPRGKQRKTPVRKKVKSFDCTECGKKFRLLCTLKEHMPVHTGERNFPCDICCKSFTAIGSRNRHKLTHRPKLMCNSKAFKGVECKKEFETLRSLERHVETHDVEKTVACSLCNKTFASKNNLSRHMAVHDAVKKYPCHLCDKRFGIANQRRLHVLAVHGTMVKPFECAICGRKFAIKDYIRRHVAVHDEENKAACYICGNMFNRIGDRDRHMLKHEVGRAHKCKVCGDIFLSGDYLEWHVKKSHKRIEKLECPVCKKTFTASRYLKEHMVVHSTARDFECPECKKTFSAARYLKQHLLVHSGAKDFECNVCHKSFNNRSNRNKHERMHGEGKADL